jgi:hypothetical protein
MVDVFLSYAREDQSLVDRLSAILEGSGYSVWWDRNLIGGARYHDTIEQELNAAKAVLVVWSRASIVSHWVMDEAEIGRDTGRLVPITPDGSMPPLGFRQFQVIDFTPWRGAQEEMPYRSLLAALVGLTARADAPQRASSGALTVARLDEPAPTTFGAAPAFVNMRRKRSGYF